MIHYISQHPATGRWHCHFKAARITLILPPPPSPPPSPSSVQAQPCLRSNDTTALPSASDAAAAAADTQERSLISALQRSASHTEAASDTSQDGL